MRIKAKRKKGITVVKFMAKHIMLSLAEAKKRGKVGNYITYIVATNNEEIVFEVNTSQSLSKDPYLMFKYRGGNKGDKLKIVWKDLLGNEKIGEVKLK
jgi:sulfur-oxidizing protein SoxZ